MSDARRCDKCDRYASWAGMSDHGELVEICTTCAPGQDEVYSCYGCDGSGKVRSYYGGVKEAVCSTCEGKGVVRFDGSGWNAAEMPGGHKIVRNAESTRIDRAVSSFAQASEGSASQLGAERAEAGDDADREQERIRLVDGYPGDWRWVDGEWHMTVLDNEWDYPIIATVFDNVGMLCTGVSREPDNMHAIPNCLVTGDTLYDVARKLRPKCEALVKVLEGMSDE